MDKSAQFEAALLDAGCTRADPWTDTEQVGEDGYLGAMPADEKARDRAIYARELDQEERQAEREGDHHHAAWARHHASRERHAARRKPGRQARPRGAGRPKGRSARRSSERSGDSGSDDGELEPAPRRLCAFCGKDIPPERSPQATHCSDRHADRDRQRRKRQRDRARSKLPAAPMTSDFWRMLELRSEDWERLRERIVCVCNGHHLEFEPGWCSKCAHWLPDEIDGGAELYAALVARQGMSA